MKQGESAIAAVGVVCVRAGEVLLIRRGNAPLRGRWSVPGGRVEPGETHAQAALREVREETGVAVALIGVIEEFADAPYLITEFAARWLEGEPRAGDDALDARFARLDCLDEFDLTPDLQRVIAAGVARIAASSAPR
jgi:8-oxo-dGTP diphosphatase